MEVKEITVFELSEKLNNNEELFILDVREPYEHKISNIGGTLIPLGELEDRLSEIESYKDKEVIVYCRSGSRSARACEIMQMEGFTNVWNLRGGVNHWAQNIDPDLPVY